MPHMPSPISLTDDIINKTKFSVFQKGHYQDPLLALREVVSAANADVNDDDSEAIASLVHESGTRWFKARPEDGLSFPLKPADLQDDMVAARCRVRDELMKQGSLQTRLGMWRTSGAVTETSILSPSSYQFIDFHLGSMRRTSQKRPSGTSTSRPLPQAGTSQFVACLCPVRLLIFVT